MRNHLASLELLRQDLTTLASLIGTRRRTCTEFRTCLDTGPTTARHTSPPTTWPSPSKTWKASSGATPTPRRRSVVDAAREIVAPRGVDALTLEAVAERVEVAVATIYNRVGSRPALLVAVAEQAMEESRACMDAAYEAEGSPEERLRQVAAAYVRFARERPHDFRILVELADEPEAVAHVPLMLGLDAGEADRLVALPLPPLPTPE
ncbi:TetR/AcrR family transcriptional regulator [Streptomyces sp. SID5910]|uniref:TetR/AcrR family transcriptional regulator n=1 Tax=Streptomyces sp. SID5910 TaxID=2690312 RepID=UPI00136FF426|nr:TetR/AcrR family transcriptional regulator [Streptomyces sp. SID5910]MYR45921.1 TetR family transcriptional regulator [Streptomyces sp. SID5910]